MTSANSVLKALYPQRNVPRIIVGDPLAGLKLWTFFATWQASCTPQPYEYWSRVRSMVQTMRRKVDAEIIIGKVRAAKWPFHSTGQP